jgi:hypothetical protein
MIFSFKIIQVDIQTAKTPLPPPPSHKNKPQHNALLNPVCRKLIKIEKMFYKTVAFIYYAFDFPTSIT